LRRNGRTREWLRREFRNVYHYTIQGAHQTPRKEPTCTAKLGRDLVHLSSDPKYSNVLPFSPLPLRVACVPHALHPTHKSNAPPIYKDTQPRTHECSHYKESLRSTSRVCALGLGSRVGRCENGRREWFPRSLVHSIKQATQHGDQIRYEIMGFHIRFTKVISHKVDRGSDSGDKG
jgi:hypothetical protein